MMKKTLSTLALLAAGIAWADSHLTEAEVRKVDPSAGKITLKHGEIKSLDMPPMTMVFGVRDASVLGKVKAGDKVLFSAAKDGGQYVVVEIEPKR